MTSGIMLRPVEPKWLREVAADSFVRSKDVAEIFGYANASAVFSAVRQGSLPEPDHVSRGFNCRKLAQWRVATIRAEIKRREKVAAKAEKGGAK